MEQIHEPVAKYIKAEDWRKINADGHESLA